jgi:hypothetical protein
VVFWRWRAATQCAVWFDRIVVATPPFDQNLSLAQRGEDLAVEQLIPNAGVDALEVAIFPSLAGCENAVFAPTASIQARTFFAINSAQ